MHALAANMFDNPYVLLGIVAAVLIVFGFLIFLVKRYRRCP